MPPNDPTFWTDHFRRTLERYDEALLRRVAAQLIKPRNQWPVAELVERCVAATTNAAIIDRRLAGLSLPQRRLLAFMGHGRQSRWRLGSLLELLAAVGHRDGPQPALELFEAGLLYPDLPEGSLRLKNFEQWLGQAAATGFTVVAPPLVTARAIPFGLGLPDLSHTEALPARVQDADGLDWPLRLAVLWQMVANAPLRRTQQGDFFKRDMERLRGEALLHHPSSGEMSLPDPGILAVALAQGCGLLEEREGELKALGVPSVLGGNLTDAMAALWVALLQVDSWEPQSGWRWEPGQANPYPSAYLLAMLLLSQLSSEAWTTPAILEGWICEHHPYWSAESGRGTASMGLANFLLGVAHELRLVQASGSLEGQWRVRLSPLGRWLLGIGERPAPPPEFAQMLLVQPNLEIIAYRQGLTPELIARLSLIATWKSIGAACTLQLEPDTIYRALESGLNFEQIVQILERHSTRALSDSVLEVLRTWADKRDRITVYPSAVLLEFNSAEDLNEALVRGLPAVRITDRLAAVARESDIDYRHYRLIGTRDYSLPPEKCVQVEEDGVTLSVDPAKADLLLECELPRFAEPVDGVPRPGQRCYRLTTASLRAARATGYDLLALETWFQQRAGQAISPAARLLMTASEVPVPQLKKYLVMEVASRELAEGLLQWPATGALIESRLGPTALVIAEANVEKLREQMVALGMKPPANS